MNWRLGWVPWVGSMDLSRLSQISVELADLSLVSCCFDWGVASLLHVCWDGSFICHEVSPLPADFTAMFPWWPVPCIRAEVGKHKIQFTPCGFCYLVLAIAGPKAGLRGWGYSLSFISICRRSCEELWPFNSLSESRCLLPWFLEDAPREQCNERSKRHLVENQGKVLTRLAESLIFFPHRFSWQRSGKHDLPASSCPCLFFCSLQGQDGF